MRLGLRPDYLSGFKGPMDGYRLAVEHHHTGPVMGLVPSPVSGPGLQALKIVFCSPDLEERESPRQKQLLSQAAVVSRGRLGRMVGRLIRYTHTCSPTYLPRSVTLSLPVPPPSLSRSRILVGQCTSSCTTQAFHVDQNRPFALTRCACVKALGGAHRALK